MLFPSLSKSQSMGGTVINWDTAQWDIKLMTKYEGTQDIKQLCNTTDIFLLPFHLSFNEGTGICRSLMGQMNVITDLNNQKSVISLMNSTNQCTRGIKHYKNL